LRDARTHTAEVLSELYWAQDMGYAQSKCVAEHLCMAVAKKTGVKTRVFRVGQIVADTVHGVWNDTEAIPLIMQSALTVGALPKLQYSPSWTPVDVIAKAVSEIALSEADSIVAKSETRRRSPGRMTCFLRSANQAYNLRRLSTKNGSGNSPSPVMTRLLIHQRSYSTSLLQRTIVIPSLRHEHTNQRCDIFLAVVG
tara:strand:+ start:1102 stop:1692 length:591 start_codon:yes stop_codon:yes gene_type:complete